MEPAGAKLTPQAIELCNFFEQYWTLYSALPTKAKCVELDVCSAALYDNWVPRPSFKEALKRRGITPPDEYKANGVLSEHQIIVANALFDTYDNRSRIKKLRELQCSPRQYEMWLRDPNFQAYVRQRGEHVLGDNSHDAHLALLDRVRSGDVNAIKYYNEITGRYIPNTKDSVDVNAILHRVLEIIMRHVPDAVAQAAIAEEMLAMSTNQADRALTSSAARPIVELKAISNETPVGFGEI